MTSSRLIRAIRAIVRDTLPNYAYLSHYRYRVIEMRSNRVALQAVNRTGNIPDILPISQMTGVPGTWGNLSPGQIVLVTFAEGDPSLPVITHFEPKDGDGFLPIDLCLNASNHVVIGASDPASGEARPLARVGDMVELTLSGIPGIPGAITAYGIITSGCQKTLAV